MANPTDYTESWIRSHRVLENCRERLQTWKEEFASEFDARVKNRTPVRTGRLRRNWQFRINQGSISFWNRTPYAGYVENGTEKMVGRHMLRQTLAETRQISAVATRRARTRNPPQ